MLFLRRRPRQRYKCYKWLLKHLARNWPNHERCLANSFGFSHESSWDCLETPKTP